MLPWCVQLPINPLILRLNMSLIKIVGDMCGIDYESPIHHFINSVFFKPIDNDLYW